MIPGQMNEMWLEARTPGHSRGMCARVLRAAAREHGADGDGRVAGRVQHVGAGAARRRRRADDARSRIGGTRGVRAHRAARATPSAGTEALGRVGPDLTHVASRSTIGAGALDNTPANLARWIRMRRT